MGNEDSYINVKYSGWSGNLFSARTGEPVLVVLEPNDSSDLKRELDLNEKDGVKLWVLNRIPIYVTEDNNDWYSCCGDYQGCLTDRKVRKYFRKGKAGTYRVHIIPKKTLSIHYTAIPPKDLSKLSDRDPFKILNLSIENAKKNVKRPYPEGFTWKEFDRGIFKNGIRILKIPSDKIIYPYSVRKLNLPQSYIFKNHRRFDKYREKHHKGELLADELADDNTIKELIKDILGKYWCGYLEHTTGKELIAGVPEPELLQGYLPEEGHHYFMYFMDRDALKEEGEKGDFTEITGKTYLYGMTEKTKPIDNISGKSIGNLFENFSIEKFCRYFYAEIRADAGIGNILNYNLDLQEQRDRIHEILIKNPKYESMDDRDMRIFLKEKVKSALQRYYTREEAEVLLLAFYVGIGMDRVRCTMQAFTDILKLLEFNYRNEANDVMANLLKDKKDKYIYTVKKVNFATGSDGFSNDSVPIHVYYQLKMWWKELPLFIKKDLKDSEEVEVIGFSSRFTTETTQEDNERLRKDRAWKTACSLKLLFSITDEEKIPCHIIGKSEKKEKKSNKSLPIIWWGAPIISETEAIYPNNSIFNREPNFVEYLPDSTKITYKQTRNVDDNTKEDRVSLIIFKRKMPADGAFKDITPLNFAQPIYQYKTVIHDSKYKDSKYRIHDDGKRYSLNKTKRQYDLVLLYACPGMFVNQTSN
jgi:hypothetical protein